MQKRARSRAASGPAQPGPDWEALVAVIDRALGTRVPSTAADAAMLIARAEALVWLSQGAEALGSLERVLSMPSDPDSAELPIETAHALRMWLQLADMLGTALDPSAELSRIDRALDGLPGDDLPAAIQWRAELMVEKALMLERADRDGEVAGVLEAIIDRFAGLDDPHAARAAAWALRNRIAARLDAGDDEDALADVERLDALWTRPEITEHAAAVLRLLMIHGHADAAVSLFTENFDADIEAALRELPVQQARMHLGALVGASDQEEADAAALSLIEVLHHDAPAAPELAELLELLEAEFSRPHSSEQ